jgi:hypothetical protein
LYAQIETLHGSLTLLEALYSEKDGKFYKLKLSKMKKIIFILIINNLKSEETAHVNNHQDPVLGCTLNNYDFCLNGAECAAVWIINSNNLQKILCLNFLRL